VNVGIASSIAQMELELMWRLKTALDPRGILNAARVLPD
jgi:FAD/FMN-containing dehydrogenase